MDGPREDAHFTPVGPAVDLAPASVARVPADLEALGHIMRALISRPGNLVLTEEILTGADRPTRCTRVTLHGSVVIDGSHRRALDREAARWQQVASLPDQ